MTAALRSIITPTAILRLVLGWGVFIALQFMGSLLAPPVPLPLLVTALLVIIAVILICAFGVVTEAEHLANRLGDPYGSLVLTISICLIEVILIAAVLLGPGDHATIARDSVMAVSMIILNAVIGLCLLVGGLRHGALTHNRTGVSNYLVMIVVFAALAFAVPALIGTPDGAYEIWQEIPIIVVTVGAYAFFLYRQMGPQAHEFTEAVPVGAASAGASSSTETTRPSLTEAACLGSGQPTREAAVRLTTNLRELSRSFRPTVWRSSFGWSSSSPRFCRSSCSPTIWPRCSMTAWAASALRWRCPEWSLR